MPSSGGVPFTGAHNLHPASMPSFASGNTNFHSHSPASLNSQTSHSTAGNWGANSWSGNNQFQNQATGAPAASFASGHHSRFFNGAHSAPAGALTLGLGTAGRRLDLDLTSQQTNIVLGSKMFQGLASVIVDVGGVPTSFAPGAHVTAAEFVAVKQVIDDKSQSLVLNSHGAASGGHFSLNSVASPRNLELVVPADVVAVDSLSSRAALNIGGALINYGSIVAVPTDTKITSGVIKARSIDNEASGVISTELSAALLATLGGVTISNTAGFAAHTGQNTNLTLNSAGDISNTGTILSSGNLNLMTGSGTIANHGVMTSLAGNLNISSPEPTTNININAAGGKFQALAGNINVRNDSYQGAANVTLSGGDYISRNLNIYSGAGTIEGNVGDVTGQLNTKANVEHFTAQSKTLALGNNCINGDPTFVNTGGNIQIQGLNTFAEDVSIIASGDITADNAGTIVASGSNVNLVAGAKVSVSAGPETTTVPGSQIGAGTTATVDFTPGAGTGGDIDLSGSAVSKIIDTTSLTGFGGNVTLAAMANGTTGGHVVLNSAGTIATGAATSGKASGSVTVLAGADPASTATTIQLGNVDTTGGAGVIGGNITVATAQPTGSSGKTVIFDDLGKIAFGGPIVAGAAANQGQIATGALKSQGDVMLNASSVVLGASSPISALGNVTINTGSLSNDAAISTSNPAGAILVASSTSLTVSGTGSMVTSGGGATSIALSAGGPNILSLTGNQTFDAGASGTVSFNSQASGGSIILAGGTTQTINSGSAVNISSPNLTFAGDKATIAATGASAITINGGGATTPLTITVPDSGAGTISTNGGTINIISTAGQTLEFAKLSGSGTGTLNLDGGPVTTDSPGAMTMVDSNVLLASDNTITLTAPSGLYGIAFQPYVGPWVGGIPVLFNTYTLDQVTQLLTPVAADFSTVSTYGQGFAPPDGQHSSPFARDSDQYIIQAASGLGVKVSAGIAQWVNGTDNWDLSVSEAEIDYAIAQAKTYGNVTELVVTNESITDQYTANSVLNLIQYAQTARNNAGFTATTLPVTTRQIWAILGGVNNPGTGYQATLKQILQTVDGYVYANMYPYYDVGGPTDIATQLGNNPTQATFTSVVQSHMTSHLTALQQSFTTESLTTNVRIGETGWPTQGSNFPQTDTALANTTYASWYYQAMQSWAGNTSNVPIGGYFEALNEPWKGNAAGTSSEQWFGLWQANGTSSSASQYTLNSVTPVFSLTSARAVQVMGSVSAANVQLSTPVLVNNGLIRATSAAGGVDVQNNAALAISGTGTIQRTGGGTGAIDFTAGGPYALSFAGNQTVDPGVGGTVQANAPGTNGAILVNGTLNLPSDKTTATFNSSSFTLAGLINTNSNPGTKVNFNLTGTGVIANPSGNLDLKDINVNTGGNNLSLLASGNIINTGAPTKIDTSSNVTAGGSLVMFAGYNLTLVPGVGSPVQYAVGAPSGSGGSINLNASGHEVSIDTSGATGGGKISAYAQDSIGLLDINASGGAGAGAPIVLQGVGVTARNISTAGSTGDGTLTISSQTAIPLGVVVGPGTINAGTVNGGALGGNIVTSNLTAGSVNLTTDGATNGITFSNILASAHSIILSAGSGSIMLPTKTITVAPDSSGNGGTIFLEAAAFVFAGGPLVLNATGTTGLGGQVTYFNTSSQAQNLTSSTLQINAGGASGGSATISSGGNLTVTPAAVFNVAPTDKDGNGAAISLNAGVDYLTPLPSSSVGALTLLGSLSADGSGLGKGGSISLASNSPTLFTLKVPLSVQGSTPGSLTIVNKAGGLTISQPLQAGAINLETDFNAATSGKTKPNISVGKVLTTTNLSISVGAGGRLTSSSTLTAPTMQLVTINSPLTLNVNTGNLTVTGGANATITNKGTGLLTVNAASAAGKLSITSAGDVATKGDISGTYVTVKTSANNGDIDFGGNVTATDATKGTVTVTANGSGNITVQPGSAVTGTQVILSTASGDIGAGTSIKTAVPVATLKLSAKTTGSVNVTDSTAVTLTGANSKKSFTLRAAGQITVATPLISASAVSLDNSSGNADIVISRTIGSTNSTKTINLATNGRVSSGTQMLTASTSIDLSTIGTALATKSQPTKVNTPLLTINGAYPGFANVVSVADSFRGTVTLGDSTVGGNLVLTTTGATNLQNISVTNGSILVTSSTGVLQVAPGATITTASTLGAGTGSITLQGLNTKSSSILVGNSATIASTLAGGGDVTLLTGKTATATNSLPAGTSGNTQVVLTGGKVFAGAGFVSNAPLNILTAIGENIVISGSTATSITLDGGVKITADPPLTGSVLLPSAVFAAAPAIRAVPLAADPMVADQVVANQVVANYAAFSTLHTDAAAAIAAPELTTAQQAVFSAGSGPLIAPALVSIGAINQTEGWENAVSLSAMQPLSACKQIAGTTSLAPYENIFLGGLTGPNKRQYESARDLDAALHCDTDYGLQATTLVKPGTVLENGHTLIVPSSDIRLDTPLGVLSIAAKSVVLVSLQEGILSVYNLHDVRKDAVVITSAGQAVAVPPGRHLSLSSADTDSFEIINPVESVCHRSMNHLVMKNGLHAFSSEVSVPSVVCSVKQLRAIFASAHPQARRLTDALVKTTVVLLSLSRNQEPYQEMPHPRVTAYKQ